MNWSQVESMIERLQKDEVATMNKIEQLAKKNDKLPSVPMSFTAARDLVAHSPYNVVVCGEVKKGKSTLLNAIIGQNILPVDNEIATSQVFRITNSRTESFALVFTDGTQKAITRAELSRYGSQVDANLNGEPVLNGRILSHIQVNVPITFLPDGVSLVDTPGLGALYTSHERITQNYVSQANAIVFVLDPEKPIGIQEKKFILRALDVTSDIIFVLTKIDLYTPEAWREILTRNEKLLKDICAEKGCYVPNIMPVSSIGLMAASKEEDDLEAELNLEGSMFPQVKSALIRMMFKSVGILRTGLALNESVNHVCKVQNFINDMLSACAVDAEKELNSINSRKMRQQQSLQDEWGMQSQKRFATINQIGDVCNKVMCQVRELVSQNGPVCREYMAKIDAVHNMDQVKALAKNLPQSVVSDVTSQWQSLAQQAESQVAGILSNINTQIGMLGVQSVSTSAGNISVQELSIRETISCWKGSFLGTGITSGIGLALAAMTFPVIGGIVAAAGAVLSWIFGKAKTKTDEVEHNKQNFRQKLYELLNELSAKLLQSQGNSGSSVVGKFATELQNNAQNAIQSIFESRQRQMQQQLADIERQARVDIQSRKSDEAMWLDIKNDWQIIEDELKEEMELKNQIEREIV